MALRTDWTEAHPMTSMPSVLTFIVEDDLGCNQHETQAVAQQLSKASGNQTTLRAGRLLIR